jgi:BirA family biotin operon repressor/biotin-[acetyl-CoA-carboxylase] ligase
MSLILRGELDWLATLPLRAAVAVCDTAGPSALIQWPNDVVIAHPPERGGAMDGVHAPESQRRPPSPELAKLAGILTEGRPQEGWAVLGIGLNVAVRLSDLPAEVRPIAATLGRSPQSIEPTLSQLLDALQERFGEPTESLLAAWQERDGLRGREIAWGPATRPQKGGPFAEGSGGRGRAEGIDAAGHLLVGLAGGSHTTLDAGEVRLLSPP